MKTFAKSEKDTFEIKNNLREAIYKSGLNITKVANKLDMTQGNLSHILNPTKNTNVSVYITLAICEVIGINIHSILPSKVTKAKKPKAPVKLKMSLDNKKFVMLANDTITVKGQKVYRIKALEDFGMVKKDSLGGYIAKESNLSFKEDSRAWIGKDAVVMDNASVLGHAHVTDYAIIAGNSMVKDVAVVCGNAEINGNCFVMRSAVVTGNAKLNGKVVVTDDAIISEDVSLDSEIRVYGTATISGDVKIEGKADIGFNIENKDDFIIYKNPYHSGHVITTSTVIDYMCLHNFDDGTRIMGDSKYILDKIKERYPIPETSDGQPPVGFGTVTNIEDLRQYCHQMQSYYVKLIKQHRISSMVIRRKRIGVQ